MRTSLLCLVVCLSTAGAAAAQGSKLISPPVVVAPRAGAAEVRGACADGATVHLTIARAEEEQGKAVKRTTAAMPGVPCAGGGFVVDLSLVRLERGSRISATQTFNDLMSAETTVGVVLDGPVGDQRDDLETSFYVGLAVDRFAAKEILQYLNPEDNAKEYVRGIGGADFDYRLFTFGGSRRPQLWVYGETLHGVRSEDVDCSAAEYLPACQKELGGYNTNPPGAFLYMLRQASTLEAFTGFRFEFLNLNLAGSSPARLYVKRQWGFVGVSKSDGDVKDMHHWGVGATVVGGARAGSYLEFGYGRTDLFRNATKRWKIDGHFAQDLKGGMGMFVQMFGDFDGSNGADAIQSYIGLSYDMGRLFGAN